MTTRPLVGTLGEKPLHAALKRWYSEADDRVEEPVDGFVIDLVRDGLLIEIQTGGFSSMKRKLASLLEVVDRLLLDSPETLAALLPSELPLEFTTADLAGALRRRRRLAQQMAYCLQRVGVIEKVGKAA